MDAAGWRLGLDTFCTRVVTGFKGGTVTPASTNMRGATEAVTAITPIVGARPAGTYNINDQGTWALTARVMRTFSSATQ